MFLENKTLFITGASPRHRAGDRAEMRAGRRQHRGRGEDGRAASEALRAPSTTAAAEIEEAGGRALPLVVDVRDEAAVKGAIDRTVERFGGLDIVVNNASAISLTATPQTDMKRYDLMQGINTRGTYMVSKYAIPHLGEAANPTS